MKEEPAVPDRSMEDSQILATPARSAMRPPDARSAVKVWKLVSSTYPRACPVASTPIKMAMMYVLYPLNVSILIGGNVLIIHLYDYEGDLSFSKASL